MDGQKTLSLIGMGLLVASQTQAGEILNLKAGTIRLAERSSQSLGGEISVIQFHDRITAADRAFLEQNQIQILRYLPDDALVVRGTPAQIAIAQNIFPSVRAVTKFSPEWKLSSELSSLNTATDLLVQIFDGEKLKKVTALITRIQGVKLIHAQDQTLVVKADAAGAMDLAQLEEIEWIETYPMVQTFEFVTGTEADRAAPTYTGYESGNRLIGMEKAWERGFTGAGQIASMGDTGMDTGNLSTIHADFAGRVPKGYTVGWGSTGWNDPQGHGTHVAGSIFGNGAASAGNIRGGAHGAQFIPVGLWSPMMNNLMFDQDFNKIIGTPAKDGARVHSNSWGADVNGAYDAFAIKVDTYIWNNPDVLVVFAAGNSGKDLDKNGKIDEKSVSSPGTAKNVLTVGASENLISEGGIQKTMKELKDGATKWGAEPIASDKLSDKPEGIAAFSSVGPTSDGRLKPEIVAPGTNIVSTRSKDPKATLLWGEFDANYVWAGGTSMATPITAGAATVVREFLVKDRKIENPSASLLKATLIHTAKDLAPGQYGTGQFQELKPRPDVHQGFGRVDTDRATSLGAETAFVDNRDGVGLNEFTLVKFTVTSGTLRATLSYADAPGSASAGKALVNDLALSVQGPNNFSYERPDAVNNTEMVELKDLAPGEYQVTVTGMNIPQGKNGKVPFALVVSP